MQEGEWDSSGLERQQTCVWENVDLVPSGESASRDTPTPPSSGVFLEMGRRCIGTKRFLIDKKTEAICNLAYVGGEWRYIEGTIRINKIE